MNALYDKGREGIGGGNIDLDTDDIRVACVSSGYTVNLATHQFVSDLGANIVARSGALTSKSITAGIFDADDVTITFAASQPNVAALVLFKHTGSDATARLIGIIDTASGLPFTPNPAGGDAVVTWPNGTNKIFKL